MGVASFLFGSSANSRIPKRQEKAIVYLDRHLADDGKFIGKVFKGLSEGRTNVQIADKVGHKNTKSVTIFEYAILGLRGDVPLESVQYKSRDQLVYAAERYLKKTTKAELKEYLEKLLAQAKEPIQQETKPPRAPRATEPAPIMRRLTEEPSESPSQDASEERETESKRELERKPGVYVYSYPQYLSMESISPGGTALYKIGASGSVAQRIERQQRQTEVPEDLVLVRVFYHDDPFEVERKIHNILKAANMHQKTTQGGVEWFSCNLATIDAIATAMGLGSSAQ